MADLMRLVDDYRHCLLSGHNTPERKRAAATYSELQRAVNALQTENRKLKRALTPMPGTAGVLETSGGQHG